MSRQRHLLRDVAVLPRRLIGAGALALGCGGAVEESEEPYCKPTAAPACVHLSLGREAPCVSKWSEVEVAGLCGAESALLIRWYSCGDLQVLTTRSPHVEELFFSATTGVPVGRESRGKGHSHCESYDPRFREPPVIEVDCPDAVIERCND